MRTFKLKPRTPAQIASRDAVVTCLYAREAVNQEIKEHGAASPQALAAGATYKATRITATKALRHARECDPGRTGAVVAQRRRARFGGLPATTNGLRSDPAPEVRTEAEMVAAGQRLGLAGSDLEMFLYLQTRPDCQLARVIRATA